MKRSTREAIESNRDLKSLADEGRPPLWSAEVGVRLCLGLAHAAVDSCNCSCPDADTT